MSYILKTGVESFVVVDGPFAGRKYKRDQVYAEIPPQEKKKFVKQRSKPAAKQKTKK